MTVGQLIDELKQLDPSRPVVLLMGFNELANGCECQGIEVTTGQQSKRELFAPYLLGDIELDREFFSAPTTVVNLIHRRMP